MLIFIFILFTVLSFVAYMATGLSYMLVQKSNASIMSKLLILNVSLGLTTLIILNLTGHA